MASSKGSPGPHDRRRVLDPKTGEFVLPPKPKCIRITRAGARCKRDEDRKGSKLCKTHRMLAEQEAANLVASGVVKPAGRTLRQRRGVGAKSAAATKRHAAAIARRRGRLIDPDDPAYGGGGDNPDAASADEINEANRAYDEEQGYNPDAYSDSADPDADPDPDAYDPYSPGGPSPEPKDMVIGGITTAVRGRAAKATANFVITKQAREALRKLGQAPDPRLDPKRVLLDTVESAWRQRQVWEAMLAAIPMEDWSDLGKTPIPGVQSSAKGARIEVIQKFLLEATKVSARTSKLAIDAGIEERLVRLAEEQAALIADTVRAGIIAGIGALAKLGMISPQSEAAALEAAMGSAATHLRQLAAGEDEIIEGIARAV